MQSTVLIKTTYNQITNQQSHKQKSKQRIQIIEELNMLPCIFAECSEEGNQKVLHNTLVWICL